MCRNKHSLSIPYFQAKSGSARQSCCLSIRTMRFRLWLALRNSNYETRTTRSPNWTINFVFTKQSIFQVELFQHKKSYRRSEGRKFKVRISRSFNTRKSSYLKQFQTVRMPKQFEPKRALWIASGSRQLEHPPNRWSLFLSIRKVNRLKLVTYFDKMP